MRALLLLVITSIFLFSCEKSNNNPPASQCNAPGNFTVTIDGQNFSAQTYQNTLIRYDQSTSNVPFNRFDIRATDANGVMLILSFHDFTSAGSGDGIVTGNYIQMDDVQTGTENSAFASMINDVNNIYDLDEFDSGNLGTFNVTSCDPVNKTISGNFSFTMSESGKQGTNGQFTNLCYSILR